TARFGEIVANYDGCRIPLKSADRDRRSGPFPYRGHSRITSRIPRHGDSTPAGDSVRTCKSFSDGPRTPDVDLQGPDLIFQLGVGDRGADRARQAPASSGTTPLLSGRSSLLRHLRSQPEVQVAQGTSARHALGDGRPEALVEAVGVVGEFR